MLCEEVQKYLSTSKGLPFFYITGDDDYNSILDSFKQESVSIVRMSDFCFKDDKFPSVDELVDYFRTSDIDYRNNKFVVIGLGEYLALRGADIAEKELLRLKDTTLGNARAILLLRGVSALAIEIVHSDNKMLAQRRAYISPNTFSDISVTNISEDIGIVSKHGIKHLLYELENGNCKNIFTCTSLFINNAMFSVHTLDGAYDAIKYLVKGFNIDRDLGNEDQWNVLLSDLRKFDKNINTVFEKNNIDNDIVDDLYSATTGEVYRNWLVFLYLKLNFENLGNSYLKLVTNEAANFEDFKTKLMIKFTEITHNDNNFKLLYNDRKRLLKHFPEEVLAVFIKANEMNPMESIYRLTDNTLLEKKTIIKWISHYGLNDAISYVYPALNDYLKKYNFECPILAKELTEYFDSYKKQKVLNHISDEFIALVESHASKLSYAKLPTRDNAIKVIPDRQNAYLYWIDALGVEYMSYFVALAHKKGLSIHTDIVRADLPTITSVNKRFYDIWDGGKKYKEEQLDNIKHKDKGGYFFTNDEDPIHIPKELEIIENAMRIAALELSLHNCKSFVIASDHGASRLAVIKKQEMPYETDTKGEHSGRCCKTFDAYDVPYKVEDNGFICLSDYGRFKGSRSANVEVHGGASLEEIVVPIITLTLNCPSAIQIKVLHPDDITADRHNGVTLELQISDVYSSDNVSIIIEDKRYLGQPKDKYNYYFALKDIKRARIKPYDAEVFDGEDLIGSISFKVNSKTAKVNDDFNFDEDF